MLIQRALMSKHLGVRWKHRHGLAMGQNAEGRYRSKELLVIAAFLTFYNIFACFRSNCQIRKNGSQWHGKDMSLQQSGLRPIPCVEVVK